MTRIVKILSCILLFSFFACLEAHAQTTIKASSCSESDVKSALGKVSSGSVTVTIPSGTCAWTNQLKYAVPSGVTSLTIQGNTAVACAGTGGTSSYSCTATDSTVITDSYASNASMISFTINGNSTLFRLTGLTIEGGGTGGTVPNDGFIQFFGSSHNLRIDHNHFNMTTFSPAVSTVTGAIYGDTEGVIDHNIFDLGADSYDQGFFFKNDIGDSTGYGDGTWASPTDFGSSKFMFVENNVFNGGWSDDCGVSGRFVMRYNNFYNNLEAIHMHATKSDGGRWQGCRASEIYHNYIAATASTNTAAISTDSGPSLIWGNTMASGFYYFWYSSVSRNDGSTYETAVPNGWGYCGTTDHNNGVGSPWDGNQPATTGYPCLDGIGRGIQQIALNGQNFPNAGLSTTSLPGWPNQDLEPVYMWDNSILNRANYAHSGTVTHNNRDYYYDCGSSNSSCSSGFTGAAGTGYGTLANRPSTCTAGPGGTYGQSPTGSYGVAYFATDANNGRGELYVCTSTNTWTPVYKPYVYPDPLVSGGTPDPPDSLTAAAH